MSDLNFLAEMKRRNVYKVAVAYAVVGWLVIQISSTVLPTFHAPEWVVQTLMVLVALGFPIALVMAWAFEATPEGIKRTEFADAMATSGHKKHAWIYIVVICGAISAALFFLGRYTAGRKTTTSPNNISSKSIAVLPFENLSSDKENAYFAEGIQDEILTRLSKIAALKVISRTSTQKYKSAPDNLREVGKQLGVANLLEGSVQKVSNAVHVNVQLIRANTDEHLWAESYNRKLDDIFGVEGEVATAIAEALNAKLSGSEKRELSAKPTNNPAAYEAYLRGLASQGRADALVPNILSSIQAFEEAVRLDPDFALAWAQLSRQQSFVFNLSDQTPRRRDEARKALETAMKLGPDQVETQLADGFYHYWVERDYEGAKSRFETVRAEYPNDAWPPYALAAIARRQNQWEQSRRLFARAIELNPQDVFLLVDATLDDIAVRDPVSALKRLARVRDLSPGNSAVLSLQADTLQLSGDIAGAQALLDRTQPEEGDVGLVSSIVSTAILSRNYGSAISVVKAQLERPQVLGARLGTFENFLADLQRHANDKTAADTYRRARAAFERALRDQPANPELVSGLAWAYAGLGDQAAALEGARRAVALLPAAKDALVGPSYEETLARIQARFGDKDNAIAALQHLLVTSYSGPPVTPALLRLDPDWDNLRDDPRFQRLCEDGKP